jgi:hypothetical protein
MGYGQLECAWSFSKNMQTCLTWSVWGSQTVTIHLADCLNDFICPIGLEFMLGSPGGRNNGYDQDGCSQVKLDPYHPVMLLELEYQY